MISNFILQMQTLGIDICFKAQRRFIALSYVTIAIAFVTIIVIDLNLFNGAFITDDIWHIILFHAIYGVQCIACAIVLSIYIFWIVSVKFRLCLLNDFLRLVLICRKILEITSFFTLEINFY